MLQLKIACAESEELASSEGVNASVNTVLLSTPVRGVLSMLLVMVEGRALLLAGFSYSAMMAYSHILKG